MCIVSLTTFSFVLTSSLSLVLILFLSYASTVSMIVFYCPLQVVSVETNRSCHTINSFIFPSYVSGLGIVFYIDVGSI